MADCFFGVEMPIGKYQHAVLLIGHRSWLIFEKD
jgi:hypothetical protein